MMGYILVECLLVEGVHLFSDHLDVLGFTEIDLLFTRLDKAFQFIYIPL